MDRLTFVETKLEPGDLDELGRAADEMDLDPLLLPDVGGAVCERVEVEVGVELAIDAGQEIEVEGGGDPCRSL